MFTYAYMDDLGTSIVFERSYPNEVPLAIRLRKRMRQVNLISPPYDKDTQVSEGPFDDPWTPGETGPLVRRYVVRNKTQAELDAEKDAKVTSFQGKELELKLIFKLANQVRELQGNPPLTPAQFLSFVRGLL